MIIRLIDVVLIVLFGFIVISDIVVKGSLRLPSKQSLENKAVVAERKIPVYIEIDENRGFTVFRKDRKKIMKNNIPSLEGYVISVRDAVRQKENKEIAVIIRPHEMSPLQATIDVLDLCDRHGIAKNIARRSLALF